jgi:hypothetical protein
MDPIKVWLVLFLSVTPQATLWAEGPSGAPAPLNSSVPNPKLALAKYFAAARSGSPWSAETIEIEASIPKLAKNGRLLAIRRLAPFGKPEYQVLEMAGDRTVKQQVIARYLSAEVEAAALPPASVAVAPPNYRFRYAASIADGGALTYIFEITPQKKRAGLIRGQLWIDAGTGAALRLTGHLVRVPSIFLRRINLTRDTSIRDGLPCARITRLEIDTRLVGRADLTITERPYSAGPREEATPAPPEIATQQQVQGN